MKHGILWSNLSKIDENRNKTIWWNPNMTDRFLDIIENENKEWQIPPDEPIEIRNYKWIKYTIDRNWIIRWQNWNEIQPTIKWNCATVRLYRETKNAEWKFIQERKKINILSLMWQYYWKYIKWYSKYLAHPEEYELITIDWNPKNLSHNNLKYVNKNEYLKTRKRLINVLDLPFGIMKTHFGIYAYKALSQEGSKNEYYKRRKDLEKKLWIRFNEENYVFFDILYNCWWILENSEIARILKENEKNKTKKELIGRITRARIRLEKIWRIRAYEELKTKRIIAMDMISNIPNSHLTLQEIAKELWLQTNQVEYLNKLYEEVIKMFDNMANSKLTIKKIANNLQIKINRVEYLYQLYNKQKNHKLWNKK